mgnify:CR=1 FL=1
MNLQARKDRLEPITDNNDSNQPLLSLSSGGALLDQEQPLVGRSLLRSTAPAWTERIPLTPPLTPLFDRHPRCMLQVRKRCGFQF